MWKVFAAIRPIRLFTILGFMAERGEVSHMGGKRIAGIVLLIVGIIVLVLATAADVIGLGLSPEQFGYRQIIGVIAGVIVAAVGLFLSR